MKNDFNTTGKCDLALVREKEYALPWVWALAKKSLYTESINRGLVHIVLLPNVDIQLKLNKKPEQIKQRLIGVQQDSRNACNRIDRHLDSMVPT